MARGHIFVLALLFCIFSVSGEDRPFNVELRVTSSLSLSSPLPPPPPPSLPPPPPPAPPPSPPLPIPAHPDIVFVVLEGVLAFANFLIVVMTGREVFSVVRARCCRAPPPVSTLNSSGSDWRWVAPIGGPVWLLSTVSCMLFGIGAVSSALDAMLDDCSSVLGPLLETAPIYLLATAFSVSVIHWDRVNDAAGNTREVRQYAKVRCYACLGNTGKICVVLNLLVYGLVVPFWVLRLKEIPWDIFLIADGGVASAFSLGVVAFFVSVSQGVSAFLVRHGHRYGNIKQLYYVLSLGCVLLVLHGGVFVLQRLYSRPRCELQDPIRNVVILARSTLGFSCAVCMAWCRTKMAFSEARQDGGNRAEKQLLFPGREARIG